MSPRPDPHARELADVALVDEATHRLEEKDLAGAEEILRDVVARTPPGYASETVEGDRLFLRCWVQGDYVFACLRRRAELARRKLAPTWLPNAYGRARFHLAFIHIERGELESAVAELDRGLALDPGHPTLLLEKIQALMRLRRMVEAAEIAASVASRDDVLPFERARALRALGNALVETGELDAAEGAYRSSLEIDPDSALARQELRYIGHLRSGGRPKEVAAPPITDLVLESLCSRCGLPLTGPGVAFMDERGVQYRCAACERRRTKRWWELWK